MSTTQRTRASRSHRIGPVRPQWLAIFDHHQRRFRRRIKDKMGWLDPLRVDVYGGYAGDERAFLWGRALENEVPSAPRPDDGPLDNLRRSLRLLRSDEVPGLELSVSACDAELSFETDSEGYFCAELNLPTSPAPGLHPVNVRVVDDRLEKAEDVRAEGTLIVPNRAARFGVVSDVDDTILRSHVQNRLRQAYLTLFGNAITRLSFDGTPHWYRGLEQAGHSAPFFYVSRSAWNIHALFEHFIRIQGFPPGALILRDVALFNQPEQRRGHKRREIERIFATYPEMSFILIGDSGQADAAIYADLHVSHPGRVEAVLIRNLSDDRRQRELSRLFDAAELTERACVFAHADQAERWCRDRGLWRKPRECA